MSQFDANKDYYGVLGVEKDASQGEIYRQYKRQAAKHHPDRGGNEEQMKTLNEAYAVLKDTASRRDYDDSRVTNFSGGAHVSSHASDICASVQPRDLGLIPGQALAVLLDHLLRCAAYEIGVA